MKEEQILRLKVKANTSLETICRVNSHDELILSVIVSSRLNTTHLSDALIFNKGIQTVVNTSLIIINH